MVKYLIITESGDKYLCADMRTACAVLTMFPGSRSSEASE